MSLHRRLGHPERATDHLVALPLHHVGEHFQLTLGQAEIRGRDLRPTPTDCFGTRRRQLLAHEDVGWDIDSAGEHQLQSAQHDGTPRGFRNEAERAEVECPPHAVVVIARRKNDDRYGWIALLQVGEHVEAVAVRQIQVEQNQLEVGMLLAASPGGNPKPPEWQHRAAIP